MEKKRSNFANTISLSAMLLGLFKNINRHVLDSPKVVYFWRIRHEYGIESEESAQLSLSELNRCFGLYACQYVGGNGEVTISPHLAQVIQLLDLPKVETNVPATGIQQLRSPSMK
ncbi:hypothetical protein H5410_025491 [Solanum commersonii]|uniref:Uncharacterized protein n=1 Tax=Solanum commersonii TaxID=4109 RepID=A0A9J5YW42_SOLCO|nr:hypothetical protein H5410_025491 [Solanum commersonii]